MIKMMKVEPLYTGEYTLRRHDGARNKLRTAPFLGILNGLSFGDNHDQSLFVIGYMTGNNECSDCWVIPDPICLLAAMRSIRVLNKLTKVTTKLIAAAYYACIRKSPTDVRKLSRQNLCEALPEANEIVDDLMNYQPEMKAFDHILYHIINVCSDNQVSLVELEDELQIGTIESSDAISAVYNDQRNPDWDRFFNEYIYNQDDCGLLDDQTHASKVINYLMKEPPKRKTLIERLLRW